MAKGTRRNILKGALLGLTALAATLGMGAAQAAAYPDHPVTIIVPFAPGGSADVYARILSVQLGKLTGQSFIIDNRPGAGAIIGTEAVVTAKPDGYTLLLISNTHTVNETLFAKKPYVLTRDLVPVAPINSSDLVLVTRPGLGVKTMEDLIKLAKSKPGALSYASSGPGTPYHMAGELLKQMAGIDILHVPYKGSDGARVDTMGGQVDMMFDATTTMAGAIQGGKVVPIATTGDTKSSVLTNLPTVAATVPGYNAVIWLGVMAPKGTPDDIVSALNGMITKIAQDPAVVDSWKKQGAVPVVMGPKAFGSFISADVEKWAKVVKLSGAKSNQ